MDRRKFVKNAGYTTGMMAVAPVALKNFVNRSPNDTLNVAVVGISGSNRPRVRGMIGGRGMVHVNTYADIPNVRVTAICDVDERLLSGASAEVEKLFGQKPRTEVDFRELIEDKDIDIISVATPDHWHALQTVWACQAGKDVYVEKPAHQLVAEGKKMIEAARKYDRIVQNGITWRSSKATKAGVKFIADGKLGDVYMARGIVYRHRVSIGHMEDGPIPEGVHWDIFLGPAPYRPFNENRYIYQWHWFWDTGTTEFGNNGIYRMDGARWALNIDTHPVKIHCSGGLYGRKDDQEVPNILSASYEYEDGKIIQNEVRSLYTNPEGVEKHNGTFIYSDEGWMALSGGSFKTYFGKNNEPGPSMSDSDLPDEEKTNVWENFVECVRSRKREDLDCDIAEGHLSASLGHLGNISYRTGRKLTFDPKAEKFVEDKEADTYLTRDYRPPYVMPEKV
jgi:predicted dehydrogenase